MSLAKPQGKGLFLLNLEHEAKTCAGVSEMLESNPLGDLYTQHMKTHRYTEEPEGGMQDELAWRTDTLTDQCALRAAPHPLEVICRASGGRASDPGVFHPQITLRMAKEGPRGLIKDQRTFLELAKVDQHFCTSQALVDLSVLPDRSTALATRPSRAAGRGTRPWDEPELHFVVLGMFFICLLPHQPRCCAGRHRPPPLPRPHPTHTDAHDGHYLAYSSQFLVKLRSSFFSSNSTGSGEKETQIGLVSYFMMFIMRDLHQFSLQGFHPQPPPYHHRGQSPGKEGWHWEAGSSVYSTRAENTSFVLLLQAHVPHRQRGPKTQTQQARKAGLARRGVSEAQFHRCSGRKLGLHGAHRAKGSSASCGWAWPVGTVALVECCWTSKT